MKTKMTDTVERREAILRLIPVQPKKISTSRLQERLKERGHKATLRTIQRDLIRLSRTHRLVNDMEDKGSRPYGWSYHKSSEYQGMAAMDPIERPPPGSREIVVYHSRRHHALIGIHRM